MSNHFQPGGYEITNNYFSQDTLDRIKKANKSYEPIFDDKDVNLDSFSIEDTIDSIDNDKKNDNKESSNNNNSNNNDLSIDTKNTSTSSNYRNKKKIAAEAGFSVRNSVQKEPIDTCIQINSASPDSANGRNLKEDSKSPLKVNIDELDSWSKPPQISSLRKSNTLSKPERQLTTRRRNLMRGDNDVPPVVRTGATKSERANAIIENPIVQKKTESLWVKVSKCCTCWALPVCLKMGGMTDKNVIQAWREK
ncbi:hypothetical protein PIROE2DRAFT_51937, partial [Piromyces sp. E2]